MPSSIYDSDNRHWNPPDSKQDLKSCIEAPASSTDSRRAFEIQAGCRDPGSGRRNGIEIVVGVAPGTPFAFYLAGDFGSSLLNRTGSSGRQACRGRISYKNIA
jgi:hypothetical protein